MFDTHRENSLSFSVRRISVNFGTLFDFSGVLRIFSRCNQYPEFIMPYKIDYRLALENIFKAASLGLMVL